MKKLLLICIIIVGIVFIAGCIGGEKATNTEQVTAGTTISQVGQETTILANTDWQAKLEADKSNKDYAERIRMMTHGGGSDQTLFAEIVPANTKEIKLSCARCSHNFSLTDISIDRKTWVINGFIKNEGTTPAEVMGITFFLVTETYEGVGFVNIQFLNGHDLYSGYQPGELRTLAPGKKLSFETTSVSRNDPQVDNNPAVIKARITAPYMLIKYS